MARPKNDGRGRIGGRQKGTPNRASTELRDWLQKLLTDHQSQIEKDLKMISPEERLRVLSGLLNYVLPKQQSITAEASIQAEYQELEKLLRTAPEEAIDRIAEKVLEMQEANTDE